MDDIRLEFYKNPLDDPDRKKSFVILAIIYGIFGLTALISLYFENDFNLLSFKTVNPLFAILLSIGIVLRSMNILSSKNSQFIIIGKDQISFRTKAVEQVITLPFENIANVKINVLTADFTTKNSSTYSIDFSEGSYKKIMELKSRLTDLFASISQEGVDA